MGWAARSRGTFKQRKAKAIERDCELIETRKLAEAKRLAAMTPEERAKKRELQMLMSMVSVWQSNKRH